MDDCIGAEILEEVVRRLKFDGKLGTIMASSTCIPCNMPYVNNIWMQRNRAEGPNVVPSGATNLGLIGQYVEVPQDIAFTIEYSARTVWEAVRKKDRPAQAGISALATKKPPAFWARGSTDCAGCGGSQPP